MNAISKTMLVTVIGLIAFNLFVAFMLGFVPSAADADARNEYIESFEKQLDLKKEFAAQGVTYYGIRGHANSYYSSFLIHTDKPCELPPAVDDYFRNHSLRMVTVVEQILYSPIGEIAPEIYKTQYYW